MKKQCISISQETHSVMLQDVVGHSHSTRITGTARTGNRKYDSRTGWRVGDAHSFALQTWRAATHVSLQSLLAGIGIVLLCPLSGASSLPWGPLKDEDNWHG